MDVDMKIALGHAILGAINIVILLSLYYALKFAWRGVKRLFRRTNNAG